MGKPNAADKLVRINEQIRECIEHIQGNGKRLALLLREVYLGKLYLQTHNSFASYVKEVLGKSKSRAYQLLAFANLSTIVDSEAIARELAGHSPEVQALALDLAGEHPTAAKLREALEKADVQLVREEEAGLADESHGLSVAERLAKVETSIKRALRWIHPDFGEEKVGRLRETLELALAIARE